MQTRLTTLEGDVREVSEAEIETLRGALRGSAPLPYEAGYDEARTLWNGMIDRRPGLVVRAADAGDVRTAVAFARERSLLLAIRGGGHQIAGHAVADGAMLLDLSQMRAVEVDARTRTARVEPGALLSDVDRETQRHGLAVPVGINSTTGVAGLTLGGGFGWITRKYGMTIDNLLSADVVTADGEMLHASEDENADIFWALRGGGGNFGVVSAFEFRLHPVGPEVLSGLIFHPIDKAEELLPRYARICDEAPDDLTVWAVLRQAPPLPFVPEEWHGREVLIFAACWAGDPTAGEEAIKELRGLGEPIVDVIGPHAFVDWQAAFDPLLTPGARNYWKSHDFISLPEEAIRVILDAVSALPDPQTEIFIGHLGGAMAKVPEGATAFPQRSSHFTMNVHTRWSDPSRDADCIAWARRLSERVAPHDAGSVYVNFLTEEETGRLGGAYGDNLSRLREVKARRDPDNFFRLNHNIAPKASVEPAE